MKDLFFRWRGFHLNFCFDAVLHNFNIQGLIVLAHFLINFIPFMLSRYLDNQKFLDICTFLDPRVKSLPYLTTAKQKEIHSAVLDEMSKLNPSNLLESKPAKESADRSGSYNHPLSTLLGSAYDESSSNSSKSSVENSLELEQYLKDRACVMSGNPLKW